MTSALEVKKWLRPLLERRLELALVGRNLVFKPVHHVLRGIYFDASGDKNFCRPQWYVNKTFNYYGINSGFSFQYNGRIYIDRTDEPNFIHDVIEKSEDALNSLDFSRVQTIADFLEWTEPLQLNGRMFAKQSLSNSPYAYATVLAALGRIGEARQVLAPEMELLEKSARANRARAEVEFAKRSNSAIGKMALEWADRDLNTIARLRPLLVLLESNDRAGLAALLHEWERQTVKGWRLEDVWEPTPFPIELGAGD